MTTSKAQITDSVSVTMNGEDVPAVKGPDPDRLANHEAEVKAHAARLREENGPAK